MSSYQWMPAFLLFYILNLNNVQSFGLYSKSVPLTTSNPTQNGASFQILNSNDVNALSSRWDFSSSTQIGYPMRIRLDNTWGFHPTQISTIQLTMDSSTSPTADYLGTCMAFSVNAQNYISLSIRLDGVYNNFIYPRCSQSQYITIASGDVKALVDYDGAQYEGTADSHLYWRFYKQFARTGGYDMLPDIVNYRDNSFPTIFKLTNDPIQNRLHLSYTNPIWQQNYANFSQDCQYTSFDTELGLDIYFGLDQNGETMNILNPITIRYYYQMTDNPTVTPTNNPSDYPTVSPSDYPSFLPSNYPTNPPSKNPTFLPSNHPITLTSSNYPTFLPTNPPITISPSYSPTKLPSSKPSLQSREYFESTTTGTTSSVSNSEHTNYISIIAIVGGICMCLCCVLFGIVVVFLKRTSRMSNNADVIKMINKTDIEHNNVDMSADVSDMDVVEMINRTDIGHYNVDLSAETIVAEKSGAEGDTKGYINNKEKGIDVDAILCVVRIQSEDKEREEMDAKFVSEGCQDMEVLGDDENEFIIGDTNDGDDTSGTQRMGINYGNKL